MGIVPNVGADHWPKQGPYLGMECEVCFHYDTSRMFLGTIVRDDVEEPGRLIIRLDDGRTVLATECMYSPRTQREKANA